MTTPRKPRSPRSMPVTIGRRERGRRASGRSGCRSPSTSSRTARRRLIAAANGARYGVVAGRDRIGDAGGRVGVAGDPAEPGEVLDRGVDAGVGQALRDRDAVRLRPPPACGRTRGRGRRSAGCCCWPGRHGVEHRREIDVDARAAQLAAPAASRPSAGCAGPACPARPRSGCSRSPARACRCTRPPSWSVDDEQAALAWARCPAAGP